MNLRMNVGLSNTGKVPLFIWASLLLTGCYHPPHERTPEWDLANGERRPDRLTAQQELAGVTPDSPEDFSPDAGISWPTQPRMPVFEIKEEIIATEVAPLPPSEFNPDPGMGPTGAVEKTDGGLAGQEGNPLTGGRFFKEDSGALDDRFFRRDAGVPKAFPKFVPEIDGELLLPRGRVEARHLEAEMVDAGGLPEIYEPDIPGAMLLPRKDVRFEERIYEHWHAGHHEHVQDAPFTTSVEDRWRIKTGRWDRYIDDNLAETPYEERTPYLWHPYYQSVLKGDVPVMGQDIFASITLLNTTDIEFRDIPVPSGVSTAQPFSSEFYGNGEQTSINSNTGLLIDVFRGETSFKPVEWLFRIQPVFNTNYISAKETGIVSPDPRGLDQDTGNPPGPIVINPGDINPGDIDDILDPILNPADGSFRGTRATDRYEDYLGLQQFFLEVHLLDLSENYDFAAVRLGTQTFNADFRGHVFLDSNLGYRMFGNLRKNKIQYNLAFFDLFEKESFSELNTFDDRDQNVFVANVYWQDFIFEGYTAQWSFLANWDNGTDAGLVYDSAGNIVRPSPIGSVAPHDLEAYYLGWNGEGHIGRMNISHSLYHVFGEDDLNGIAGREVDISAWMAALEVSVDTDWMRHKLTFFYGSGDDDATDGTANGWDAIVDSPNFIGGPFSYWNRQGFNLGGTAVALKQRLSLIPDLSSNKFLGQSNFVNPGIFIAGVGEEWELTPRARFFANLNYLMFVNTDSISSALVTEGIAKEIGWDLSFGVEYRPFLTDNLRLSTGLGMLFPGAGYKDIYRTSSPGVTGFTSANSKEVESVLYSGFFTAIMTF